MKDLSIARTQYSSTIFMNKRQSITQHIRKLIAKIINCIVKGKLHSYAYTHDQLSILVLFHYFSIVLREYFDKYVTSVYTHKKTEIVCLFKC